MKASQAYNDPIFGDFPKSGDDHNLSDSDEDDPITVARGNGSSNNGPMMAEGGTESDLESDIDDDDDKQQQHNDVTAQVAEDLQITDSSLSNSDSSSSDSEMHR